MTYKTRMVTGNFTPEGSAACMIALSLSMIVAGFGMIYEGNLVGGILAIMVGIIMTYVFAKIFMTILNGEKK